MASLPMVASVLTPIACARAKASTTLASAPLCSAMPTGPASSGGGTVSANGAARACAFRKPRQFGPSTVIPCPAARVDHPLLQRPALLADLAVAGREHDHVAHAGRRRVVEDALDRVGRAP